jgi:hypothetical protein
MLIIHALPGQEETLKIFQRDRLNFRAQPVQSEPVNSRQQPAVAPFEVPELQDETSRVK